ncbi:hypothetical protein AAFN88_21065 [Pelagibius sp. CAU 1746]|uniref:hypothetical protein n=1 Tax=Pelagibius sp. CAU 1746 TaxID=3140370 RepID=UPI00325BDE67
MKTRTSEKTVTFRRPFVLAGLDEILPAGAYSVETEEELIEGLSYEAYRRTATVLHLPARSGPSHLTRAMTIDSEELDAALARDQVSAEVSASGSQPRQEETDLRAVDRAEDEGMTARPL